MEGIIREYVVTGNRQSSIVRALYDADSRDSVVRRDIAENLGDVSLLPSLLNVSKTNLHGPLDSWGSIHLDIDVDSVKIMHHFYVADDLAEELIIGADMIRKWRISIDSENDTVSIDPRAESLINRTGIAIAVPVSGE